MLCVVVTFLTKDDLVLSFKIVGSFKIVELPPTSIVTNVVGESFLGFYRIQHYVPSNCIGTMVLWSCYNNNIPIVLICFLIEKCIVTFYPTFLAN
jgi:hypothetical protein